MSFLSLEIARSALAASRSGLEVASQNVANANTPGYVRQRAVLVPIVSSAAAGHQPVSGGVLVETIQRLRDQCLEAQINHQQGQLGQESGRATSLARVQTFFPDLSENGLSPALGRVFDSLQRLQTMPDSTTARQEVLFAADDLCSELHTAAGKLSEEGTLLEADLAARVSRSNDLLHDVADLNGKIMTLGGSPQANDLRVLREEAIHELAELCGAMGLDMASGSQDVLLGGLRLVDGVQVTELSLVPDAATPHQHHVAVGSLVDPYGLGGVIAGDIQARDTNLAAWRGQLDELAGSLADAVNAQHRAGYDLQGNPGQDVFTYTPGMAAATLNLSAALADDTRLLAAAAEATGPPGDGGNAAALGALRQQKLLSGGTQTLEDFQGRLLYEIGAEAQRSEEAVTARQGMVQALEDQYTRQAGVSLDEEAIEIMRFQQVYSAATKLINIADEMMEQVLGLVR